MIERPGFDFPLSQNEIISSYTDETLGNVSTWRDVTGPRLVYVVCATSLAIYIKLTSSASGAVLCNVSGCKVSLDHLT